MRKKTGWSLGAFCLASTVLISTVTQLSAYATDTSSPTAVLTSANVHVKHDVTLPEHAKLVDGLPTPEIKWQKCPDEWDHRECGFMKVPLDYRNPSAGTITVGMGIQRATKPEAKIGTLFLHPGGPGEVASFSAFLAKYNFSPEVLEKFDVIGIDARGLNFSDRAPCATSKQESDQRSQDLWGRGTPSQTVALQRGLKAAKEQAAGCVQYGGELRNHMSTTDAVLDLELARRAVGDAKLTYAGFSYGTLAAQIYANMFPDRVRAILLDSVVDAPFETGYNAPESTDPAPAFKANNNVNAQNAREAFDHILSLCDAAGSKCMFRPNSGSSKQRFDKLADAIHAKPITFDGSEYAYGDLLGETMRLMYKHRAPQHVTEYLAKVAKAQAGGPGSQQIAQELIAEKLTHQPLLSDTNSAATITAETYDNSTEVTPMVLCNDRATSPSSTELLQQLDASIKDRSYFLREWLWGEVQCASDITTIKNPLAYKGPWNKTTSAPLLFIANRHDPVTNFATAKRIAARMPGSATFEVDAFGHISTTAENDNEDRTTFCAMPIITDYIVRGKIPQGGTGSCQASWTPFQ